MSNPQGSPFAHLLRGVGNVFRGTGEYPPDILQDVATGLAAAQWRQSGGEQPIYSNPNLWQGFNYRPTPIPQVPVIQPTPIHQYTPSTVVRDALRRVESQRPQAHQSSGSTGGNPLTGMVNQAASNPIHQSQRAIEQAPYTQHAGGQGASSELFRQALDPNFGRSGSSPIQEDPAWVQGNLAHAAWPMTMLDRLALQQAHQQVLQRQQAMNAQNASARAQREHYEAQTRALREQQYREAQARRQAEQHALQEQMLRFGRQVGQVGKGAADFLILDDINTLTDPNASLLFKSLVLASFFPVGKVIKGGKLLTKVAGKSDDVLRHLVDKGLNPQQIKKYKEFVNSRSKNLPVYVHELPNGGKVFETVKPGRQPGRYAHWEQYIDKNGKTVIYGKRSYHLKGKFEHWHEYYPFKQLELTTEEKYIIRIKQIIEYNKL